MIYIYLFIYIFVYIHTYIYMCVYIYMYTYGAPCCRSQRGRPRAPSAGHPSCRRTAPLSGRLFAPCVLRLLGPIPKP